MIYKTTRIYGFIVTGAKSCSDVNVCAGHRIALLFTKKAAFQIRTVKCPIIVIDHTKPFLEIVNDYSQVLCENTTRNLVHILSKWFLEKLIG